MRPFGVVLWKRDGDRRVIENVTRRNVCVQDLRVGLMNHFRQDPVGVKEEHVCPYLDKTRTIGGAGAGDFDG